MLTPLVLPFSTDRLRDPFGRANLFEHDAARRLPHGDRDAAAAVLEGL